MLVGLQTLFGTVRITWTLLGADALQVMIAPNVSIATLYRVVLLLTVSYGLTSYKINGPNSETEQQGGCENFVGQCTQLTESSVTCVVWQCGQAGRSLSLSFFTMIYKVPRSYFTEESRI